jgi:hypothetical protein
MVGRDLLLSPISRARAGFILEPEQLQEVQVEAVFHATASPLARNDISEIGDREDAFPDSSGLGYGVAFDPVRSEDEVDVERAVLKLDEILASDNVSLRAGVQVKPESDEG